MYLTLLLNSNMTVSSLRFASLTLWLASLAADRLRPRVCRHAVPHVLAARVHPRAAPASAGLLLVRPRGFPCPCLPSSRTCPGLLGLYLVMQSVTLKLKMLTQIIWILDHTTSLPFCFQAASVCVTAFLRVQVDNTLPVSQFGKTKAPSHWMIFPPLRQIGNWWPEQLRSPRSSGVDPALACSDTGSRLRFGSISQIPVPSEVFRWEFHCSVNCVLVEGRKAGFRVSPASLDKSLGCRFVGT